MEQYILALDLGRHNPKIAMLKLTQAQNIVAHSQDIDQTQKDKVIKELLIQYGQQKEAKQKNVTSIKSNESQLLNDKKFLPKKIAVSPRLSSKVQEPEEIPLIESPTVPEPCQDLSPESKLIKKSRRPRPTYLKLNLSYGDSNTAITL